jgi:PAS domain S-box-containing protein
MSDATSTITDNAVVIDIGRLSHTNLREAADAIIYADAQGIIRFWNFGAARIFGFAEAEAVGQSLDIIIPEGLRARHWAGYSATSRAGAPVTATAKFWRCRRCEKAGSVFRSSSRSCHSGTMRAEWKGSRRSCAT